MRYPCSPLCGPCFHEAGNRKEVRVQKNIALQPAVWFGLRTVSGWDGLRMSVRDPGSLSRANGAYSVVDHFVRGWRLMKKKKGSRPHAPPNVGGSLIE